MTTLPENYRNAVVNDDVMAVLRDLPDGCVDMIYGDPDYNAGISYDGRSFTTSWEDYVDWYIGLAAECLRVLRPDGNLFFINYPKQNAYLRVKYLDEHAYAVHDYVWVYNTNIGHTSRRFTTAHRSILHATKSRQQPLLQGPSSPTLPEPHGPAHQGAHPARAPGPDALLVAELQLGQERVPPENQPSLPDT